MTTALRTMASKLDDGAMEALASKGLVRRASADVAAGRVAVLTETDASAEIAADGETVTILARSPKDGRCTCPAPGVCRHRLAALMVLRQGGAETIEAAPAEPEPADWSAVAASFTADRLARFAGKAAWPKALEAMDLARRAEVVQQAGALQVRVGPDQDAVVFLADGGLEGALTKAPERSRKLRVTIAALAVRHALGAPELAPTPASEEQSKNPRLDEQTLRTVRDFLRRAFRAAFAFAPRSLEDEARRLAIPGRVEALPRLSGLLRNIAGQIAALRRRQVDADPETLLALLSEAYALSVALESATDAAARLTLSGTVRQAYATVGDLSLYGLGARRWETAGGARGITAYFYAPGSDRTYRLGMSRPDRTDTNFAPEAAFDHAPVWGMSMRKLSGSSVALSKAAASASGRLSTGQDTLARTSDWTPHLQAVRDWFCAADDWTVLEERLRRSFAAGLTSPVISEFPVLLIFSRFAPLRFDELTQTLIWPIADAAGKWIGLTLPYDGVERTRVEAFEQFAVKENFWGILAVARPDGDRISLEPYGLWGKDQYLPDFPLKPKPRFQRTGDEAKLIDRLTARPNRTGPQDFTGGVTSSDRLLDHGWDLILRQAELGQGASVTSFAADCQVLAGRMEMGGLAPVARQFRMAASAGDVDEICLRAAWAVQSARLSRIRLPWMA